MKVKIIVAGVLYLGWQAIGAVVNPPDVQTSDDIRTLLTNAPPGGVFPPRIAARAQNLRRWDTIRLQTNRFGVIHARTNSYLEIESGLHFNQNGLWVESFPRLVLTNGEAVSFDAPHRVAFSANVNSSNTVRLLTPDNKVLRCRILGLAYFDYRSQSNVMIAELTNSVGRLVGTNRVLYPNAFDGIKADVRYAFTKSGLEQDVILRERPPLPEEFGLDPDSTRLEVWTEFFDPPTPIRNQRLRKRWREAKVDYGLDFGHADRSWRRIRYWRHCWR